MGSIIRLAEDLSNQIAAGEVVERSIARQVEFWARLGRSVELLLEGRQVLTLCHNATARPLSACLESVDSAEGQRRVANVLERRPFPHYEPHPDRPGLLVRVDAKGSRTVGRFVKREFQPVGVATKRR